jgi:hypothetical protein
MSREEPRLVVTYILPRAEDPALFDHLVAFRKGPTRTARLKSLVKNGFLHERFGLAGAALSVRPNEASAIPTASGPGSAVMDQMFDTVER